MHDYEKLGVFYLGRPFDMEQGKPREGLTLYDSSDLLTHAVCVGMTGSGKTGLCIGILEEAAIDGVPAIVIDPKGDLGNLLLTFPGLDARSFRPFVDEEEARRRGLSPDQFASEQAELWRKGLAEWDQDGARIERLRSAAEFAIYTPGSTAGLPISVLRSLDAPETAAREDAESLAGQIASTTTGLLGLLGIQSDPLRSREHILLATLLSEAWKEGRNLGLPALIQQVQSPPVRKVGVLDLEAFYPAKERFELAMAINNLLASPSFAAWIEGEPLDVGRLLYDDAGRPRVSILSIAHLGDAERMFFVTLLLSRILGWMRAQSGTSSLRAVLYMDEIFGFFPPVANPPSKAPLLTLLKQARAFGLGVVLATQNPADLDYKGLSNTGTWFIGRLQAERDMLRVLDGLEGASTQQGMPFDRREIERTLAGLGKRVFLLHNVHERGPEIFQTRWTLSYLRGPVTRDEIRHLTAARKGAAAAQAPEPDKRARSGGPTAVTRPEVARTASGGGGESSAPAGDRDAVHEARSGPASPEMAGAAGRPLLAPAVPESFVPIARGRPEGTSLVYSPMLLGAAAVRFFDRKAGIDAVRELSFLTELRQSPVPVSWEEAREADIPTVSLLEGPEEEARFAPLPDNAARAASYEVWGKELAAWLVRVRRMRLLRSPSTGEISRPDEDERAFRIRLGQALREKRDEAKQELRERYAPKLASLEERRRKAEQARAREAEQAGQQKVQTAISIGATVLGSLFGRRRISAGTLGRATTAARGMGRVLKEGSDVERAAENIEAVDARIRELEAQLAADLQALELRADPAAEALETVTLAPLRKDVSVRLVTLAWTPGWVDEAGNVQEAWE